MITPERDRVLGTVARAVLALPTDRPRLVGVDGVDGAGKTTFADQLGDRLERNKTPVVRASVDGFHRPRAERYVRGRHSPEGFYRDSYDLTALVRVLLDPLRPGGSRRVRTAVFDHRTDEALPEAWVEVRREAVVIVDGIFLHRPELAGRWDLSVFLDVSFETTFARMHVRDGCPADPADPANRRYLEGQRLYLASCDPASRATFVVEGDDRVRRSTRR